MEVSGQLQGMPALLPGKRAAGTRWLGGGMGGSGRFREAKTGAAENGTTIPRLSSSLPVLCEYGVFLVLIKWCASWNTYNPTCAVVIG